MRGREARIAGKAKKIEEDNMERKVKRECKEVEDMRERQEIKGETG